MFLDYVVPLNDCNVLSLGMLNFRGQLSPRGKILKSRSRSCCFRSQPYDGVPVCRIINSLKVQSVSLVLFSFSSS